MSMKTKHYLVVQDHTTDFPNPITFKKGAHLTIRERYEGPEGWENWIFCEVIGQEGGWVPAQIIEMMADNVAYASEDYTAKELNVKAGEYVCGSKIVNGWVWCEKPTVLNAGWVPLRNLKEI